MNGKDKITKMNNMEIKVGDKVMVSKDAPKVYLSSMNNLFKYHVCTVEEVDGNSAIIRYTDIGIGIDRWLAIPTKYLVKVDAEAKEPTAPAIKVGDRVEELISRRSGRVLGIEGDFVVVGIPYDKEKHYWHIDSVELIEPTEQTEAEKKPNIGSIKIPVEVDLTDRYWDAYAADLAKEVASKVANKYTDPKEAAEYAISVAEAVVEGLKRK